MAITNALTEVWAARLLANLRRQAVWPNVVTDYSSEVSSDGKLVNLARLSSTTTIRDYAENTDIEAPEAPGDEERVITLNQKKYFNVALDDVEKAQSKPDWMDAIATNATTGIALAQNDYIKTVANASLVAGSTIDIVAANNAKKLDNANTLAQGLINAMFTIRQKMNKVFVPRDDRWCILSPEFETQIMWKLTQDGIKGSGQISDAIWKNGQLSDFLGLDTYIDGGITELAYVGHRSGLLWAEQINELEPYRPEKRFADAIKGLFVYGCTRNNEGSNKDQLVYKVETSTSAT